MDNIFPDEIFLQIFLYLPRLDLFRGFYNLNSRLNHIISEARVRFGCFRLGEEEKQYILPYVQPKQIFSFFVDDERCRYSKLNQCINIRQLTFVGGYKCNVYTYEHPDLIHVQPSIFPRLKSLTIYAQSWSDVYMKLCEMIFGSQFPVLESVHLPYANGSCTSGIKTWSTNLKYVRIECCNKSMFYPLLNNLPNILTFNCGFGASYRGSLTKEYLPLKKLYLETYDRSPTAVGYQIMFGFNEMMDLFKRSPDLEHTILYICDSGRLEYIIDQLYRVLSNCPKLRFDCNIKYFQENSVSIHEIIKGYPLFQDCSACTWGASRDYGCRIRGINALRRK